MGPFTLPKRHQWSQSKIDKKVVKEQVQLQLESLHQNWRFSENKIDSYYKYEEKGVQRRNIIGRSSGCSDEVKDVSLLKESQFSQRQNRVSVSVTSETESSEEVEIVFLGDEHGHDGDDQAKIIVDVGADSAETFENQTSEGHKHIESITGNEKAGATCYSSEDELPFEMDDANEGAKLVSSQIKNSKGTVDLADDHGHRSSPVSSTTAVSSHDGTEINSDEDFNDRLGCVEHSDLPGNHNIVESIDGPEEAKVEPVTLPNFGVVVERSKSTPLFMRHDSSEEMCLTKIGSNEFEHVNMRSCLREYEELKPSAKSHLGFKSLAESMFKKIPANVASEISQIKEISQVHKRNLSDAVESKCFELDSQANDNNFDFDDEVDLFSFCLNKGIFDMSSPSACEAPVLNSPKKIPRIEAPLELEYKPSFLSPLDFDDVDSIPKTDFGENDINIDEEIAIPTFDQLNAYLKSQTQPIEGSDCSFRPSSSWEKKFFNNESKLRPPVERVMNSERGSDGDSGYSDYHTTLLCNSFRDTESADVINSFSMDSTSYNRVSKQKLTSKIFSLVGK